MRDFGSSSPTKTLDNCIKHATLARGSCTTSQQFMTELVSAFCTLFAVELESYRLGDTESGALGKCPSPLVNNDLAPFWSLSFLWTRYQSRYSILQESPRVQLFVPFVLSTMRLSRSPAIVGITASKIRFHLANLCELTP